MSEFDKLDRLSKAAGIGENCTKKFPFERIVAENNQHPDEYYGSEEHYDDLMRAAGLSAYHENPETLHEAGQNLRRSFGELKTAICALLWRKP